MVCVRKKLDFRGHVARLPQELMTNRLFTFGQTKKNRSTATKNDNKELGLADMTNKQRAQRMLEDIRCFQVNSWSNERQEFYQEEMRDY